MTKLIELCPQCGSGHINFCQISVRPYCVECNYWAPINYGTKEDAIKNWNKKVEKSMGETMTLEITKLVFYLSYQDGRIDDKEYNTREEAQKILDSYGEFGRDICIMCYRKKVL